MNTNAMPPWNVYDPACPTRLMLDRVADKWTVLVVGQLATGVRRFGELRQSIRGISPKILTQTLRGLERDGLLTRRIYASIPPKVEYRLTPLGETLVELLAAIRVWAETHIEAVIAAQQHYDASSTAADDDGSPRSALPA